MMCYMTGPYSDAADTGPFTRICLEFRGLSGDIVEVTYGKKFIAHEQPLACSQLGSSRPQVAALACENMCILVVYSPTLATYAIRSLCVSTSAGCVCCTRAHARPFLTPRLDGHTFECTL
jgi:hypothetical protein